MRAVLAGDTAWLRELAYTLLLYFDHCLSVGNALRNPGLQKINIRPIATLGYTALRASLVSMQSFGDKNKCTNHGKIVSTGNVKNWHISSGAP
jgi:hypothetical protein